MKMNMNTSVTINGACKSGTYKIKFNENQDTSVGKPGFDDFYVECFDRVSKMKEITEEQRYAFIFRDEVRNLMLNKLADGSSENSL